MVRVRFAPSPTGFLHIGGARTALFNYLFAKKENGVFVLRVEDTDLERSKAEYEEDIKSSLEWLGITWDEGPAKGGDFGPYRQTERGDLHREAAEKLLAEGKLYKDDDGTLRLPYVREEVVVPDLICGDCLFTKDALGPDPVMVRANGTPTFHLANVVDDAEMGITHVIRGQDHLVNTAKHILLFEALGKPVPKFAHIPLILGEDRSKLSKRNSEGMVSVKDFRDNGYTSQALVNILMLLGWSHPEGEEHLTVEEVSSIFALGRVNKTAAVFEPSKLNNFNGWWIRNMPIDELARQLQPFVANYQAIIESKGQQYWLTLLESLRAELEFLKDIQGILELIFSLGLPTKELPEAIASPEQKENFRTVASVWKDKLSEASPDSDSEAYSEEQFAQLLAMVKKEADVPKKAIFQGVRFAITGKISGPELKLLVPLISRESLQARTEDALSLLS